MSGAPHRGWLFRELGVVPPAWLKGFDFAQKDVSGLANALWKVQL